MDDIFYKPFLKNEKTVYFPYTREKLSDRPMFPTYVMDGGASFFCLDKFGTVDSDRLLDMIMDGSLFEYWTRDGVFDWSSVFKDFRPIDYAEEWEGHIWINRLYIILIVAQKYCRTGNERYAEAWLKILRHWYKENPYSTYDDRQSDKIWEDMQVTWRSINIVHSVFLLGKNKSFGEDDWSFIYELIGLHAEHMLKEGKRHALDPAPDNHKLQIGTALIMFATLFPELFDSKKYIEVGSKIVSDNMKNSIFSDGCNNEDSMSYSHFIARLYLESELFLKKNGYDTIPGCAESIRRQYEFLYHFASPSGKTLRIGDSYSTDAIADIEFINSFYPLDFDRKRGTRIFASSRMAVLRSSRFDVYVDAMDMTEWHQHYGRPHVIIYADGMPILADSGSINYDRGGLRCQLNSARGHNVIVCDELPLEDHLTKTSVKEELSFEEHDNDGGAQRLVIKNTVSNGEGRSYVWLRTIEVSDDFVEITDGVSATEKMSFTTRMHLPDARIGYYSPHSSYQPLSEDCRSVSLRFGSMMESVFTDAPFEIEYTPSVDESNSMNYCQVLVRKHFTDSFTERTLFRFDPARSLIAIPINPYN